MIFNDARVTLLKKANTRLRKENEKIKNDLNISQHNLKNAMEKVKLYDSKYDEFCDTIADLKKTKEIYDKELALMKELRKNFDKSRKDFLKQL